MIEDGPVSSVAGDASGRSVRRLPARVAAPPHRHRGDRTMFASHAASLKAFTVEDLRVQLAPVANDWFDGIGVAGL